MTLKIIAAAALVLAAGAAAAGDAPKPDDATLERGAYLARIMDCAGCHTPRGPDGAPIHEAGLSGGTVGFEIPGLGIFWPPNLTPDETGIAGWTKAELIAAIRAGVRPDGRALVPVMPWPNYAALSDEDADALATWLLAAEPVAHALPAPQPAGSAAPVPFYRVILPE